MAKGLTRRQEEILRFIVESIRDYGRPPTIAEIGEQFGITSTNGVNDHLVALEKKGYIERSSKARGIYVTAKGGTGLYQNDAAMAPLLGHVAAGQPILAEENIEDYVAVSGALAKHGVFCLTVHGDSMIEDGILDGDTVVVDPTLRAKKGDVVVAMVDDDATVKYYHPKGRVTELHPANATMEPIIAPTESLALQGVVVSVQRALK